MNPIAPLRFTLRHEDQHGFAVARGLLPSALLLETFPLPPRGAEILLAPRFGQLPGVVAVRCEVHAVRTSLTLEASASTTGLAALDLRGPGLVAIIRAVDLATDDPAAADAMLGPLGVTVPLPPARLLPIPGVDGDDLLRALPEPPGDLSALERALGRDSDAQRGAGPRREFGLDEATPLGDEARARLLLATDETPLPRQPPADSDDEAFGPGRRGLTGFLSGLLRRGRTTGFRGT